MLLTNGRKTETPVYHDFVQEASTKIWLQRLTEPASQRFFKKPTGYMVFRVDLADDIKGKAIAEWLKAAAPKQVTAVEIEAVVLRARQLQGLRAGAFTTGSMLSNLSQSARNEIVQALYGLHTTLASASHHAEDGPSQGDSKLVRGALGDIQRSISAVCDAVETPVLQDLDDDEQEIAGKDPFVAVTGTSDAIMLRKAVRAQGSSIQGDTGGLEIPFEQLHHRQRTSDSSSRVVAKLRTTSVIIETVAYEREPSEGEQTDDDLLKNVRRMAALLSQVGRSEFHILPCRGFFHDRGRSEKGLVFDSPPNFDDQGSIITLRQLYEKYPLMPLGHRIHLAHALCVAMDHFHRVGWVHKSFRSSNIDFCPSSVPDSSATSTEIGHDQDDLISPQWEKFDLSKPYIFGYDDARPQDAGTRQHEDYWLENNLYRHPDRWGNPRVKFEKMHDVYALVSYTRSTTS